MSTKEQLAANRKNAKKSTGPKSPAGKARTKLNRLTHGLRAEQFVLPSEDAAEFQAFVDAWMADWKPQTMARAQLVKETAVAAWRKQRCVRSESTRLGKRIRDTMTKWRTGEEQKVEALVEALDDDPAEAVDALMATRAGVERLIAMWEEIAEAATPDGWDDADAHHFRIIALCGLAPEDDEADDLREASWRLYLRNAAEGSVTPDQPEPFDDAEAEEAAAWLRELTAEEISDLREVLAALPDETSSWLCQAEAAALVPQKEDVLLLRYETQRSREFHRALGDLTKMAQTGSDLVEIEEGESGSDEELPTEANSSEVHSEEGVEGGFSGEESVDASADGSAAEPVTRTEAAPGAAGTDSKAVARPKRALKCM